MPLIAIRCLLACALVASPVAGKTTRPPPVAVEARFKERITAKLQSSLSIATKHLAWVLGVGEASGDGDASAEVPSSFGWYELVLAGKVQWRSRCEVDTDIDLTVCVLHKLQALSTFCTVKGAAAEHRKGVVSLLRQLVGKRDHVVSGLGVKRALLPIGTGLEAWFYEKTRGSGDYDVSVTIQAAAMLAVVQCGNALGDKEFLSDIQSWFVAVTKVYTRSHWDKMSFHSNAILLESFILISMSLRRASSFAHEIRDFVHDFESYMQAALLQNPKAWSFSGAHAAVVSWAGETRSSLKGKLGRVVKEYLTRWRALAPGLNVSSSYTCGPLQGIAPLLFRRGEDAAELVGAVLRLAEKDIDLFQVVSDHDGNPPSLAATRLGTEVLSAHGKVLQGAFFRDEQQLQLEKRNSIRIDDTAQCVLGLFRTLQLVEDIVGVEVPEQAAGDGTSSSEGAEL